ncbi:MAG: SEC-C domain-containing protein [Clostridia bacterium]|nr:SEC-C domain-containing protein [Clostridia bacterium]
MITRKSRPEEVVEEALRQMKPRQLLEICGRMNWGTMEGVSVQETISRMVEGYAHAAAADFRKCISGDLAMDLMDVMRRQTRGNLLLHAGDVHESRMALPLLELGLGVKVSSRAYIISGFIRHLVQPLGDENEWVIQSMDAMVYVMDQMLACYGLIRPEEMVGYLLSQELDSVMDVTPVRDNIRNVILNLVVFRKSPDCIVQDQSGQFAIRHVNLKKKRAEQMLDSLQWNRYRLRPMDKEELMFASRWGADRQNSVAPEFLETACPKTFDWEKLFSPDGDSSLLDLRQYPGREEEMRKASAVYFGFADACCRIRMGDVEKGKVELVELLSGKVPETAARRLSEKMAMSVGQWQYRGWSEKDMLREEMQMFPEMSEYRFGHQLKEAFRPFGGLCPCGSRRAYEKCHGRFQ